jgi:hypothetical protein
MIDPSLVLIIWIPDFFVIFIDQQINPNTLL